MVKGDKQATYDKERIHLNIARLKKSGQTFEIDLDPDEAIKFKKGQGDIASVVKAKHIFSDVKKGLLAPTSVLETIFGSEDTLKIAEIILREGEIQFTAEYRKSLRQAKLKKIINTIHQYGVDPRTNAPHPLTRIENAITEAKVKIDEFKSADEQVKIILKQLMPVMPIKFEIKEISFAIPHNYASKAYPCLKKFGNLTQSRWENDGSLNGVIELPGGLEEDFYDKLNSITHGNIECKIMKVK